MASYTVGGKTFNYAPNSRTIVRTDAPTPSGYTTVSESTLGGGQTTTTNVDGNVIVTKKPGTWVGPRPNTGGGNGVTVTRYAVTPLDVVKKAAVSGKDFVYPEFADTPSGNVEKARFISEVYKIRDSLASRSPEEVISRQLTNKAKEVSSRVDSYTATGNTLSAEAERLTRLGRGLNTSSAADVAAYNKMVSDFNAKQKAYESEGKFLQKEVKDINVRSKNLDVLTKVNPAFADKPKEFYKKFPENTKLISSVNQDNTNLKSIKFKPKEKVVTNIVSIGSDLTTSQKLGMQDKYLNKDTSKIKDTFVGIQTSSDVSKILNPEYQKIISESTNINQARGTLGRQLISSFDAALVLFPVGSIASSGIKTLRATKTANLLAKTNTGIALSKLSTKATNFLKPTVTYSRYSPITETRALEGTKQLISGKGRLLYEEKGLIAKLLNKKPTQKFLDVSYKFDVKELYSVIGKSKGKIVPSGSPYSLQSLIPEERLISLISKQKSTIKSLRGRTGFIGEGIIKIKGKGLASADYRIVSESVGTFGKQVRVRVAPIGLENAQIVSKFKLLSAGDSGLSGGSVRSVTRPVLSKANASSLAVQVEKRTGQLIKVKDSGLVSRFVQKLRVEKGAKFNVNVLGVEGTSKSAFDVGKISVKGIRTPSTSLVSAGKDTLVKQTFKSSVSIPKASINIPKSSVVSSVSKTAKQYLDVYGFQNALKPVKTIGNVGVKASSGFSVFIPQQTVDLASNFGYEKISQPSITNTNTISIPAIKVVTPTVNNIKYITSAKVSQATPTKVTTPVATSVYQIVSTPTKIITPTNTSVSQATPTKFALKESTLIKTTVKTPTSFRVPTSFRIPIIPPVVPIPSLKFGKIGFPKKGKKKLLGLFDVEIRKKGKFRSQKVRLTKSQAIKLGINITDKTIARTFRLKQVGFGIGSDQRIPSLNQYRLPKGRSSLKAPLTYVERSRFAINTPGEKKALKVGKALKTSYKLPKVFNY